MTETGPPRTSEPELPCRRGRSRTRPSPSPSWSLASLARWQIRGARLRKTGGGLRWGDELLQRLRSAVAAPRAPDSRCGVHPPEALRL